MGRRGGVGVGMGRWVGGCVGVLLFSQSFNIAGLSKSYAYTDTIYSIV